MSGHRITHEMNKASISQMELVSFVFYKLIKVYNLRKIHNNQCRK